jgi:hypothetical protein
MFLLVLQPPKQKISDPDELQAYRLRQRKVYKNITYLFKNTSVIMQFKVKLWCHFLCITSMPFTDLGLKFQQ